MFGRLDLVAGMQLLGLVGASHAVSGCYVGVQTTTTIANTDPIDESDNMPSSTLSFRSDNYEVVGGLRYKGMGVYTGMGIGTQQINSQTGDIVSGDDDESSRFSFGISLPGFRFDRLQVRFFGTYSTQFGSITAIEEDTSRVDSSWEAGLQIAANLSTEESIIEPTLRIGIAKQSGVTNPSLYRNESGDAKFTGNALLVSIGFYFGKYLN